MSTEQCTPDAAAATITSSQRSSTWNGWKSTHQSAIVIIPPDHCWQQIQQIRSQHDRSFQRWMPHINMIYPFIENTADGRSFSEAAAAAGKALEDLKPFVVRFTADCFRCFQHSKKSCTLWLKPVPAAAPHSDTEASSLFDFCDTHSAVLDLHQRLDSIFHFGIDSIADTNKPTHQNSFIPHLSVGQFQPTDVMNFVRDFRADWSEIEFTVSQVAIISRAGYADPFTVKQLIKFGGTSGNAPDAQLSSRCQTVGTDGQRMEENVAATELSTSSDDVNSLKCVQSTFSSNSEHCDVTNSAQSTGVSWGGMQRLKFS